MLSGRTLNPVGRLGSGVNNDAENSKLSPTDIIVNKIIIWILVLQVLEIWLDIKSCYAFLFPSGAISASKIYDDRRTKVVSLLVGRS